MSRTEIIFILISVVLLLYGVRLLYYYVRHKSKLKYSFWYGAILFWSILFLPWVRCGFFQGIKVTSWMYTFINSLIILFTLLRGLVALIQMYIQKKDESLNNDVPMMITTCYTFIIYLAYYKLNILGNGMLYAYFWSNIVYLWGIYLNFNAPEHKDV